MTTINPCKLDFYGYHKWLAERIVEKYCDNYLIFRLGSVVGKNMKKGPLFDILNKNKIEMSLNSKLTFINSDSIAYAIFKILQLNISNEIFNLTGHDNFLLKEVINRFPSLIYNNKNKKYIYDINVEKISKYLKLPTSTEEAVLKKIKK